MIVPDVNLLLYATISAFPHHPAAHSWWEGAVNDSAQIGLAPPAIFGFLRISTNARVLENPLPLPDAIGYIEDWLNQPNIVFLSPGPRHLAITLGLLAEAGTAGNLTTDAQLAAYAVENQGEMYSNDSDFARFTGLSWVNPLR